MRPLKRDHDGASPLIVIGVIAAIIIVLLAAFTFIVLGGLDDDEGGHGGDSGVNEETVIGYIEVSATMHIENSGAWLEGVTTHIKSVDAKFVRTKTMDQPAQFAWPDMSFGPVDVRQRVSFEVFSMSAGYQEGPDYNEWATTVEPNSGWDFTKHPSYYFFVKSPGTYTIKCTLEQFQNNEWVFADTLSNTVVVA